MEPIPITCVITWSESERWKSLCIAVHVDRPRRVFEDKDGIAAVDLRTGRQIPIIVYRENIGRTRKGNAEKSEPIITANPTSVFSQSTKILARCTLRKSRRKCSLRAQVCRYSVCCSVNTDMQTLQKCSDTI